MMSLQAHALTVHILDRGRKRTVLDIPSVSIHPGEAVGIIGPSGSGKTTLLHVLAGLHRPSQGWVHWGDQDLYSLPQGERDKLRSQFSGMIFQDFRLNEGLSALDNVLLPLWFRHWRIDGASKERAVALLQDLGIREPHLRAGFLSRGEMQRVALARAIFGEPTVIFADEPTASLDAPAGLDVADLLLELTRTEGLTLLCVTHDSGLQARMDRCLILEGGQLTMSSQAQLVSDYEPEAQGGAA